MNKDLMIKTGFKKQIESIESGNCPICKDEINIKDFKDYLSIKEYRISGLCQKCQDKVFD